ncbi:MAG: polyisoprenoid-binding protein [Dehalococcoidia bacterium]|nr:polyisoprenoid-binding protein [Dehalococcoidia bacterium]
MPWTLDTTHADVSFSARHMIVTTVRGHFAEVEADIHLDETNPEQSHVTARIKTASLDTGAPDRDAHLRSADFFDVENHPEIVFRSTRVECAGEACTLVSDLTIRDITKPVTLQCEFAGPVQGPCGGRHICFEFGGEIEREDWGLGWNVAFAAGGLLVGKKVKLHLAVEVVEAATVAA